MDYDSEEYILQEHGLYDRDTLSPALARKATIPLPPTDAPSISYDESMDALTQQFQGVGLDPSSMRKRKASDGADFKASSPPEKRWRAINGFFLDLVGKNQTTQEIRKWAQQTAQANPSALPPPQPPQSSYNYQDARDSQNLRKVVLSSTARRQQQTVRRCIDLRTVS